MPRVVLPNNFIPRPYQRPVMRYLDDGGKRAVCVWHRRGGKDLVMLHQTAKMMVQRRGVYWHVFPSAEQGRKAIWEGFTKEGERTLEQVFPKELRRTPSAFSPGGEMVVTLKNGSIWRLVGSDRMEVVGAGPVGVVFSEFALAKPTAWDLIRPMLRENDGWATFISTPRGTNHFKRLFDMAALDSGWFQQLLTLYDTRAYDPDKTIAEERSEGMQEALIRQEYLCDWTAAMVGTIWGDLIEHLEKTGCTGLDFTFEEPEVFTTWDLGMDDSTAIWFWVVNRDKAGLVGVDVLDHYETHGRPMMHYFDEVERRQQEYGWKYIKHWLPHDAKQHTLASGSSILNQCIDRWGSDRVAIGPQLSILDGIQAGRWLLQQPLRFHARCADGLEALKAYRRAWDEEKKTFSSKPVHDWASHTGDAWRYTACVVKTSELFSRKPAKETRPVAVPFAEALTLDELWAANEGPARKRI